MFGNLTNEVQNGTVIARDYDAFGRPIGYALGSGGAGGSPAETDANVAYSYDVLDRLVSDGGVAYAYDAAGNRTARNDGVATTSYALGAGDRLASWTGGAYSYDAAGCVTRIERDGRPTLDLVWNGRYQLVSVSTNGAFAEGYAYDALGRRVSTTTAEGTLRHVYDDRWQVVAGIDAHGGVVASYVWGEGIDSLLAVKVGGASYYPLTDIQGTVWGYADAANNIVARWTYDAWGNVLDKEVSVPALARLRYRFQGREWSAATGLVHFRMRWYDPETGRWLSKDPIGLSGGLNLYAFCGNSPILHADPCGASWWEDNIVAPITEGILAHWYRNEGLNDPYLLPESPEAAKKRNWELLSPAKSVYHNMNGGKNQKYVSPDGHLEAVYDQCGELVTDPYNMGTYNIYGPDDKLGHFVFDMMPYYLIGNSPDDAFDYWSRIKATFKSLKMGLMEWRKNDKIRY